MYYKKMIISGSLIEIYTYEKGVKEGEEVLVTKRHQKRVYDVVGTRRFDNLLSTKRNFVRRVSSAIKEFGAPLFVTCTYQQNITDLSKAYEDFRCFALRLRKKFPLVQYVAVPEYQKRGAIHFHCFLFNLPRKLGDVREGFTTLVQGEERTERVIAGLWLRGFVDVVQSDGSLKHINYLVKYLVKSFSDVRLRGRKLFLCSRGMSRPYIVKGDNVDFFEPRFNMELVNNQDFRSSWLGLINKKTYVR